MTSSDKRVTYRRKHSYNTRSNKIRKVKTPGGALVVHYVTKKAKGPQCGHCHKALAGIPRLRPTEYKGLPAHDRTVSRPYGGSLCAGCTRERVLRAFIVEEQKLVKKLLQEKAKAGKASA